jgi:hypothetical protein
MKSRIAVIVLVLMAAVGLGVLFGIVGPSLVPAASPRKTINTSLVLKQVQTLSELVTVKYVLEKVVILEDAKWYGESRVLFLANGVVKAGIDLAELKPEDIKIEGDGKKVTIKLPRARVTDAYLDDKKSGVIERTTGVVRKFDKDLEQSARRQAVDDIRRGAREQGILKDASERAALQMKVLFLEMGFTDVTIESNYKSRKPEVLEIP